MLTADSRHPETQFLDANLLGLQPGLLKKSRKCPKSKSCTVTVRGSQGCLGHFYQNLAIFTNFWCVAPVGRSPSIVHSEPSRSPRKAVFGASGWVLERLNLCSQGRLPLPVEKPRSTPRCMRISTTSTFTFTFTLGCGMIRLAVGLTGRCSRPGAASREPFRAKKEGGSRHGR